MEFQVENAIRADDTVLEVFDERKHGHQRKIEIIRRTETFMRLVSDAGDRYRDCKLATFRCDVISQESVVRELAEYLEGGCCCGLVLYGPVGTGKDHLAFSVLREAIKLGRTVRWVNGQRWFGMVRDAIDSHRAECDIIAEVTAPDLLCLCDPLPPIGMLTQHQATMLYRLVDARYARGKATIVTVNVATNEEADERMGAATWDRLCHDAWKIRCNWPSYRTPAREV